MSSADLAAVAAFTAAGLSLVNVVISARLTSRGSREQWRREQERPIVARCLTLSANAVREIWAVIRWAEEGNDLELLWGVIDQEGHEIPPPFEFKPVADLRYEAAQLDLLASDAVRLAVRGLIAKHEEQIDSMGSFLLLPRKERGESQGMWEKEIGRLEALLVEKTREDLGLRDRATAPSRK